MKKPLFLRLLIEFLWLLFALILALVFCYVLLGAVKNEFLLPLIFYNFLAITYFRMILFTEENLLIKNIVVRILFFMLNIPLFFAIIIQLQDFFYLFDHYDINQFLRTDIVLDGDAALEVYQNFRTILIASAVSSLMLILILEFQLAKYILKYFK
ncbi:MAG: hypothetical protein WD048_00455 [Chitinophagales bacterium]